MKNYLKKSSIIHKIIILYNLNQNDITKKINRIIMKIIKVIIIKSKLNKKL